MNNIKATLRWWCLALMARNAGTIGDGESLTYAQRLQQETTNPPCSTICANGTSMNGGSNVLPIFGEGSQTCSGVDALLANQDGTACETIRVYRQFLDLAAYCMCEGLEAPSLCTTCSGGGQVTRPDDYFSVPFLGNITFSCRRGSAFIPYLSSDLACSGFASVFNEACCSTPETPSPVTTASPGASPTTAAQTPAPAGSPASSAPTATPPTTAAPVVASPTTEAPAPSPAPAPSAQTSSAAGALINAVGPENLLTRIAGAFFIVGFVGHPWVMAW